MRNKCPYLSTALECFAGSFGTVHCLTHEFHSRCEFRLAADKPKTRAASGNAGLKILGDAVKSKDMLDNLVAINF